MKITLRLFVLLSLCFVHTRALAYYDDVHYGLTYYIARQTGYTHEQAYRIASACSQVDWDPQTEPVQLAGQMMALFTPLDGGIHHPRSLFHSFRIDNDLSRRVIGFEPEGAAAQAEVLERLRNLGRVGVPTTRNPGVFLHAFQDFIPHYGYGTFWGHNPAQQSQFDRHMVHGMMLGGTTDWIHTRPADVLKLCESTNGELIPIMNMLSPHQYARYYYPKEFENLVARLANVNEAPRPLQTDLDRITFIYVALKDKGGPADTLLGAVQGKENLARILETLQDPEQQIRMDKHLRGPDVKKAYEVVNRALAEAGIADRLPPHHIDYDLGTEGGPVNPNQLNDWVLVGDATLTTKGYRSVSVTLHMDVRDATGKAKLTELYNVPAVTIAPGGSHTWKNLPIGKIVARLTPATGDPMTVPMAIMKRENAFDANVGGTPPPKPVPLPAPTKPKPPVKPPVKAEALGNFTGTWYSSVGRYGYKHDLTMSQSGAEVTGSFTHASGGGSIKGTVKGRTLTFTYKYTGGEGFSETGKGTFVISSDNKTFSGSYSSDLTDGIKNNGWRGHKLNEPSPWEAASRDWLLPTDLRVHGPRQATDSGPRTSR